MKPTSRAVLRLELNYLPPSLNKMLRVHWSKRKLEKLKILRALAVTLESIPPDYSTPTMPGVPSNNWSIVSAKLACYREILRLTST